MQEQTQRKKLNKIEFEELLLRKESKKEFDSNKFTKAKITDVSVYKGFKFFNKKEYDSCSEVDVVYTISEFNSPEKTLKKYLKNDDSKEVVSEVIKKDYINPYSYNDVNLNGVEWAYKDKKYIVVTISTLDNNYQKKYIIENKQFKRTVDNLYEKIKNKIGSTVLIGNPLLSDRVLRMDKSQPISNINYLKNAFIRSILMYTLFIVSIIGVIYFSFQMTLGIYLIPYITTSIVVSLIGLSAGIPIANKIYKNWFNLKEYDMISELPDKANISENMNNEHYNYDTADINIYENGDVIITSNNITWTFENKDSLPSQKAIDLYNEYGIDFNNENKISIIYYKNNDNEKSNNYVSDCGKWILEPHTD